MKLYVGNLSYEISESDLKQMFEEFGKVGSASIIMDKYSGQSKGFGFVEMDSQTEAQSAMEALNGKDVKGRTLIVNEARPRPEGGGGRGPGGPGGGGGRGRGPGGGGGRGPGGGRGGQGGYRSGPGGDRGDQGGFRR
ncbi:MAG: RNA-binding protein [Desulfobacterales bacterium GWB2_56_26]|nr:MAG: RNA-binding protein [Desulfobacterales bacterium GWB2_56_26]